MFNRNEISDPHSLPSRKHYPWYELEENHPKGGMWQIPSTLHRPRWIEETSSLMADPPRFADAMRSALTKWPKSVEVALTTPGLNHKAWLGRAGCFLATGSPEETTRLGWHELDDAEQFAANLAAETVIAEWARENATRSDQMTLFGSDLDA